MEGPTSSRPSGSPPLWLAAAAGPCRAMPRVRSTLAGFSFSNIDNYVFQIGNPHHTPERRNFPVPTFVPRLCLVSLPSSPIEWPASSHTQHTD